MTREELEAIRGRDRCFPEDMGDYVASTVDRRNLLAHIDALEAKLGPLPPNYTAELPECTVCKAPLVEWDDDRTAYARCRYKAERLEAELAAARKVVEAEKQYNAARSHDNMHQNPASQRAVILAARKCDEALFAYDAVRRGEEK